MYLSSFVLPDHYVGDEDGISEKEVKKNTALIKLLQLLQALPAQQNITVTNRHLDITPFVIDRDPLTPPPTDEINERKILNVNSGFLAFMNPS